EDACPNRCQADDDSTDKADQDRGDPVAFREQERHVADFFRLHEGLGGEADALPRNIQADRRAWTLPRRRWRMAPTVLKIAPCAMSVPMATVGLKPSRMTRIGVISAAPPIPV